MKRRSICFIVYMIVCIAFSQNFDKHTVQKGESITQIALKYNVTPYDIYQLNPDAQSGLKPYTVLLVPKKMSVPKTNLKVTTHKVQPKETLFGIEKKYGVSEQALKKANPDLEKFGLQVGKDLVIPEIIGLKPLASSLEKVVFHEVLPKETKYSIAKNYGITVEELEKKNPEIIQNLTVGYKLLIKGTVTKQSVLNTQTDRVKDSFSLDNYVNYQVKPKETLYSLCVMTGLTQQDLLNLNPSLNNGVEIGMMIKIPKSIDIFKVQELKKSYVTLSKNSDQRKKIVLLLPFNLSKIEGDTINSTATRLKKDKFLNMTLDFYSGVKMAIDSAKVLGLQVDINIFDSQETKSSSNIAIINRQYNLQSCDAVIGPFYQNNIEKTAALLATNNVPVISPLSKDVGVSFSNLYQTIPTADALKKAVFDYMLSKGGNIIAVVDKKKESARQFIQQNYEKVQMVSLLENGSLSAVNLKSLFSKDKINYVVLATENTGMIKSTMTTMIGAMANFNVELVIMEPNETLETDEISFENLTKLKLMYPSISRENDSDEAKIFKKEYRKKNKIAPNTYATRGFDVTFDTMLRLSQDKKFQETVDEVATEQVDNKFEYYKKIEGGYTNKGVYVLYYDTDLTIKEAK